MKNKIYTFSLFCYSFLCASESEQNRFPNMTLSTTINIDETRDVCYGLAAKPNSRFEMHGMKEAAYLEILVPIKSSNLKATMNGVTASCKKFCNYHQEPTYIWNEPYIPLSVITESNNVITGFLQAGKTKHYLYGKDSDNFDRKNDLAFTKEQSFMPWKITHTPCDKVYIYNPNAVYYIPIQIKLNENFLDLFVQKINQFHCSPKIFLLHANYKGIYLFDNEMDKNRQYEIDFIMSHGKIKGDINDPESLKHI